MHLLDRPGLWLAGAALGFFALGYAAATDLWTLIGSVPLSAMVIVPCVREASQLQREITTRQRAVIARRMSRTIDTLHRIT